MQLVHLVGLISLLKSMMLGTTNITFISSYVLNNFTPGEFTMYN